MSTDCNTNYPPQVIFNWVTALPTTLSPFNIYFVRNSDGSITTYMTDRNNNPYIISSHGGQAASDHNFLEGLQGGTTDEYFHLNQEQYNKILELVYKNSSASIQNSPTTGEKGVPTSVELSYNILSGDDIITSATINQGIGDVTLYVDAGQQSISAGQKTDSATFTLTLNYSRNGVDGVAAYTSSYTAYTPQWSGLTTVENLNEADYTTISAELNKTIQASDNISIDVAPNNEYVYFISTNSNAAITNNGFNTIIGDWDDNVSFFYKQTIPLTLVDGVTSVNLTVYRTRQPLSHSTQNYTLS